MYLGTQQRELGTKEGMTAGDILPIGRNSHTAEIFPSPLPLLSRFSPGRAQAYPKLHTSSIKNVDWVMTLSSSFYYTVQAPPWTWQFV